jgi:imidazolonepropionase-like amidohydrolase
LLARVAAFLAAHHTVVDPTTALYELYTHPDTTPVARFEPGAAKVAPALREQFAGGGVPAARSAQARQFRANLLAALAALHRAGVPIVAGTDQAVPGHSLHRELELYVEAGFTPMEAIQAATSVPARAMKLDKEVGTVEPGKRADLIVVDGDPLARIADTRKVTLVVANGRRFDPAPLWRSVGFEP